MSTKQEYKNALSDMRRIVRFNRIFRGKDERKRLLWPMDIERSVRRLRATDIYTLIAAAETIKLRRYNDNRFMSNRIIDEHKAYLRVIGSWENWPLA